MNKYEAKSSGIEMRVSSLRTRSQLTDFAETKICERSERIEFLTILNYELTIKSWCI